MLYFVKSTGIPVSDKKADENQKMSAGESGAGAGGGASAAGGGGGGGAEGGA